MENMLPLINTQPLLVRGKNSKLYEMRPVRPLLRDAKAPMDWTPVQDMPGRSIALDEEGVRRVQSYIKAMGHKVFSENGIAAFTLEGRWLVECRPAAC